jgi:pimeloyl-ACP methyl ester carboxylesterase
MTPQRPAWLSDAVMAQYESVWSLGLNEGCHYYRASPLRPETDEDKSIVGLELPASMLGISVPTLVLWGLGDIALRPGLLAGLEHHVANLTLRTHPAASHWLVHEEPQWVAQQMDAFLNPSR